MAITAQKLLPAGKGGALAKTTTIKASAIKKSSVSITLSESSIKNIGTIRTSVADIEGIMKGTLVSKKKQLDAKKREASSQRRSKQEDKLEKQENAEKKGVKMPKLPRMGFLDWIKNFIGKIILGYFAVRLIKHLPKMKPILKFIASAGEFIIDMGGKLLNGLATFIDWGYKAHDATRGFIRNFGGEGAVKALDTATSVLGNTLFVASVIAGQLAAEAMSGGDGGGIGDLLNKKMLKGAVKGAVNLGKGALKTGAKFVVGGGATAAAIISGVGLLSSALGEGSFQLKRASQGFEKKIYEFGEGAKKDPNPFTATLKRATASFVMPFLQLGNWLLNGIGVTLDIIGAPFRYAIELIRYPFLSDEDKEKQAKNLAKFDARIRDGIREHFAGFLSPLLRIMGKGDWADGLDKKGSLGSLFGEKGTKGMGYRSGGSTRGGKRQGGARRTIGGKSKRGKYKRGIAQEPKKTKFDKPKSGGLFGLFPNTEAENVIKEGEKLDKTKYFGPLLAASVKIQAGQELTQADFDNVGLGINLLIAKGVQDGQLKGGIAAAFANGGLVDVEFLEAAEKGADISGWVASTFKGEYESNAQRTMRLIKEKASERQATRSGPGTTPDSYTTGPAGTSGDALTMARNLMRDLGLTEAQAAGIVGNMVAESGVENARPQGSRPGTKGALVVDGLTGYGIVQWTSRGRQQALYDFAKSMGHDMSKPLTMDIEYKFFLKEFRGAYGNVLRQIKQARDTKAASTIFMQQYEIPAGYKTNAKIMERYNLSKPIFDKLSAGKGTATDKPGSYVVSDLASLGDGGSLGGDGKFIQGNSGASAGVHFHIGPGHQDDGTLLQSRYFADARASAKQVVDYFLGKGSTIYDGRRGVYFKSSDEVGAAQKAHTASGSAGGIDLQVDFETAHKFPLNISSMAYRRNGFGVSANIEGSKSFVAHGRYDENGRVAPQERMKLYAKGGRVRKPTQAVLGEKGPEFVFDADTTRGLDRIAPGILEKLNMARTKPQLSSILQSYTGYERPEATVEYITVPAPYGVDTGSGGSGGGGPSVAGGGDEGGSAYDALYEGG